MPMTEDFDVFFQTGDFATAAVWSVGSATVNGVFDNEFALGLGLMDSSKPVFVCSAADMPTAAQGQTLVINSTTYTINDVQPDGTGLLVLQLSE